MLDLIVLKFLREWFPGLPDHKIRKRQEFHLLSDFTRWSIMDKLFEPSPYLSDEINRNIQKSQIDGGAKFDDLPVGKALRFKTRNTVYILRREKDQWTLQGHPVYCPEPTQCVPHGSTWGGSMIKTGFLGRGMHFEAGLAASDGMLTITTTEISEIEEID